VNNRVLEGVEGRFVFRKRPAALPADARPNWRIPLLATILHKCSIGQKASLKKLHILAWASRAHASQLILLDYLDGNIKPTDVLVRFEPVVNRAMRFMVAEGLTFRIQGDRVGLTEAGKSYATEIDNESDVLSEEKQFFTAVGKRLTEQLVTKLLKAG